MNDLAMTLNLFSITNLQPNIHDLPIGHQTHNLSLKKRIQELHLYL